MSNITLTMPPDVIRRARIMAAERDTSVSTLVAALLESVDAGSADREAIWAREEAAMEAGLLRIDRMPTREEMHAR